MAIIGNNPGSPDMDYSTTIGAASAISGLRITMSEDGTPVSIWWYGTTTATIDVYAAIFTTAAPAIFICEQAAVYEPGITTEQWHEIPLDTASLSDGVEYAILLSGLTDTADLATDNGGDVGQAAFSDFYDNLFSGGTWSDGTANPGSASGGGDDRTMYLEYTPDAGGVTVVLPGFKNTNIFRHMIGR